MVPVEIRRLIREISIPNPLWGAPRIHGELLKLGIDIGQTSVAKYMARRRGPPSQGWKTFLKNHADGIAAIDLFVVPTISFRLLYGLLIMGHGRRQILWFGVTSHPTAEWMANQLTEACGWEQAPRYLIRDRDGAYGEVFIRRDRAIRRVDQSRIDYRLNSLVNSPMPSIATVTLLTGSFIDPTPSDVPQQIRSPGNNVMSCEILLTSCCALKIMSDIGYDWRSSPFSMVRTTSLAGSIPDAMTGPNGQKSSKPLARAHCANVASL